MGKPWFRVKRYGFGAGLPCSWEGWADVSRWALVVIASSSSRLGVLAGKSEELARRVLASKRCRAASSVWRKSDGPVEVALGAE
jgi:hypothetical protein